MAGRIIKIYVEIGAPVKKGQLLAEIDPKTDLSAHWHSFTLRDPSDAWYGVGGAPNKGVNGDFVDPSGNSGRNVGWEFDLEATFRPTKNWTINGGVGLFQPGSFVRKLNSGAADRQTWFFLQGTYKF